MFRTVFRPYGPVWTFFNHITDALLLSLCWCVCCLPIFTIGASTTALYDAAVHGMRHSEPGTYYRFFRTFRRELKTATASTLLWGAVLLFGCWVLALLEEAGAEDTRAAMMAGGYQVLLLVPLCAACWSSAILSRFTHNFRRLTVTAVRFLFVHPLASASIAILTRLVIWFVSDNLLALSFAPAVTVLGWSLVAEPVFAKYGGGQIFDNESHQEDE